MATRTSHTKPKRSGKAQASASPRTRLSSTSKSSARKNAGARQVTPSEKQMPMAKKASSSKQRPLTVKKVRRQPSLPKRILSANPKDMLAFIQRIHGANAAVYQQYSKDDALKADSAKFASKIDKALRDRLVKANAARMNVAVMINTSSTGNRKGSDVSRINAVFVDSDDQKLTKTDLLALAVPPHILIESSPGRFHAYWLVKDCAVDQFTNVQKALASVLGTDPAVVDLARVMRLPGSVNWKRTQPFLTSIVHSDDRAPIPIGRLIKKFKLDLSSATVESSAQAADDAEPPREAGLGAAAMQVSPAQVRRALVDVPADDRALWLRIGMAIHSGFPNQIGSDLWAEWSATSSKFDAVEQQATWNEFRVGPGIGIASLFWLADKARGRNSAMDDTDAAKLFAVTFADRVRFDPVKTRWYIFNGVIWVEDKQAPVRMALKLVNDLSQGEGRQDPAIKRYRSMAGQRAIVGSAELLEELHIKEDQFDPNPSLLALRNGVVDLQISEFRQARPSDMLKRSADVDFDADAKCPQWSEFMEQITCGDRSLALFLRRAMGYTAYGHANAQVAFIAEGRGGNGKGVFMRVLKRILGGYATAPSPNLLTTAYAGNVNSSSPALAALQGQRMCIVTEMPANKSFDAAFVKQFAGGDEITARTNYGEPFTFKPPGKLWISTNDMPEIAATDEAMWRRLITIPFSATFKGKNRDDDLEEKLWQERSGILNWLLRGAAKYAQAGLGTCTAVDEHRSKLRRESDTIRGWFGECCRRRAGAELQAAVGYADYAEYAKRVGRRPVSMKRFQDGLESLGVEHHRKRAYNCYLGLELKTVKR